MGLIRSHYVGRTFIEPQQSIRHFGVRLKLNPNRAVIEGKRVVVIDDSIVRGTTSRKIVKMIRDAGAREVHVRISSPPTRWPCYYGIDTPTRVGAHRVEPLGGRDPDYLTADSVGYLSLEGLVESVRSLEVRAGDAAGARPSADSYCHACFSGSYPISFTPAAPNAAATDGERLTLPRPAPRSSDDRGHRRSRARGSRRRLGAALRPRRRGGLDLRGEPARRAPERGGDDPDRGQAAAHRGARRRRSPARSRSRASSLRSGCRSSPTPRSSRGRSRPREA